MRFHMFYKFATLRIRNMLVGNGFDHIFILKHFTYPLQTYKETAAEF